MRGKRAKAIKKEAIKVFLYNADNKKKLIIRNKPIETINQLYRKMKKSWVRKGMVY